MSRDLSNYLTQIVIPDINDPNFVSEFNTFCNAVKTNFEKVVSAPYLKGDRGNCIESISIDSSSPEWSDLRAAIVDLLDSIFTIEPVATDDVIPGSSTHSTDNLDNNSIVVYKDDAEGKLFITNPFIFLDARRNELTPQNFTSEFEDKTIAITGTGTWDSTMSSYVWSLEGHKIIPSLYYDENVRQYCWLVNDEETHIIAQGIKGEDGRDADLISIVDGLIITDQNNINQGRIVLQNVYDSGLESLGVNPQWHPIDPNDPSTIVPVGDLVFAFGSDNQTDVDAHIYHSCLFGIVHFDSSSNEYYIKYSTEVDIVKLLTAITLRDLLNSIGDVNDVNGVRGLYIPGEYPMGSSVPTNVHMLWVDDNGAPNSHILHMGFVGYTETGSQVNNPAIEPDSELDLEYDITKAKGKFESDNDATFHSDIHVEGSTFENEINIEYTDRATPTPNTETVDIINTASTAHGSINDQFYLSLCPSFNIEYTKTPKTLTEVVETITYPSICTGVEVTRSSSSSSSIVYNTYSVDARLYFRNRIVINTYVDDRILDTKEDLQDFSIDLKNITSIEGNISNNSYVYLTDEEKGLLTSPSTAQSGQNSAKKAAMLEVLYMISKYLGYYKPGVEYSDDYPLFSTNSTGVASTFTIDSSVSDRLKGWKPELSPTASFISERTSTITEVNQLLNNEQLVLQTPWIGYSQNASNDIYFGQQLRDANGSTDIVIDITWPNQTSKFTPISISNNRLGIYWPDSALSNRRSNIFQEDRVLYYTDSDNGGTKYAIVLTIQVVRVDFGSNFYADVVYKLSDYNDNNWNSLEINPSSLFDEFNLQYGSISNITPSANLGSSSNSVVVNLGNVISLSGVTASSSSNVYKVTSPAIHFIVKSIGNQVSVVDDTYVSNIPTGGVPGLQWLQPKSSPAIPYSLGNYILAIEDTNNPTQYYNSIANSNGVILRASNPVAKQLGQYMLQIKDFSDNTRLTTNVLSGDIETYNFDQRSSYNIYPKSGLFIDERPVIVSDKYRNFKLYNTSTVPSNTNIYIQATSDYIIYMSLNGQQFTRYDSLAYSSYDIQSGDFVEFYLVDNSIFNSLNPLNNSSSGSSGSSIGGSSGGSISTSYVIGGSSSSMTVNLATIDLDYNANYWSGLTYTSNGHNIKRLTRNSAALPSGNYTNIVAKSSKSVLAEDLFVNLNLSLLNQGESANISFTDTSGNAGTQSVSGGNSISISARVLGNRSTSPTSTPITITSTGNQTIIWNDFIANLRANYGAYLNFSINNTSLEISYRSDGQPPIVNYNTLNISIITGSTSSYPTPLLLTITHSSPNITGTQEVWTASGANNNNGFMFSSEDFNWSDSSELYIQRSRGSAVPIDKLSYTVYGIDSSNNSTTLAHRDYSSSLNSAQDLNISINPSQLTSSDNIQFITISNATLGASGQFVKYRIDFVADYTVSAPDNPGGGGNSQVGG